MASLDRTARSFLLSELVTGFALTLKYMFKAPVTVNYPYEKGPLSPAALALLHDVWGRLA